MGSAGLPSVGKVLPSRRYVQSPGRRTDCRLESRPCARQRSRLSQALLGPSQLGSRPPAVIFQLPTPQGDRTVLGSSPKACTPGCWCVSLLPRVPEARVREAELPGLGHRNPPREDAAHGGSQTWDPAHYQHSCPYWCHSTPLLSTLPYFLLNLKCQQKRFLHLHWGRSAGRGSRAFHPGSSGSCSESPGRGCRERDKRQCRPCTGRQPPDRPRGWHFIPFRSPLGSAHLPQPTAAQHRSQSNGRCGPACALGG